MKKPAFEIWGKRRITADGVAVGSKLGRKLLNSKDSAEIMKSVRMAVKKGTGETVTLKDEELKKELTKEL